MKATKISSDGKTITVRVPISIRKRGGRKIVLAPDGIECHPQVLRCQQLDSVMLKALARAFRWRHMLETGTYATIAEIAEREQINEAYVSRVLRLTLLAPGLIEEILEGRQSPAITLKKLMRRFPVLWGDQGASLTDNALTRSCD
jgi:hypothetical protein